MRFERDLAQGQPVGQTGQRMADARSVGNGAMQERIRRLGQGNGQGQQGGNLRMAQQGGQAGQAQGPAHHIDQRKLAAIAVAVVARIPENMREEGAQHVRTILRQCAHGGVKLAKQVAYILATAEHESQFGNTRYRRSEPLVEDSNPIRKRQYKDQQGRSRDKYTSTDHVRGRAVNSPTKQGAVNQYWDNAYGGRLGNKKGTDDAAKYRGRGYVQLTGKTNYEDMTRRLNAEGFSYRYGGKTYGGKGRDAEPLDLVKNPTHVNLVHDLAARILVMGSMEGTFRPPHDLPDYVNPRKTDYYNARNVINADAKKNGNKIAAIARKYDAALSMWPQIFLPNRASAQS